MKYRKPLYAPLLLLVFACLSFKLINLPDHINEKLSANVWCRSLHDLLVLIKVCDSKEIQLCEKPVAEEQRVHWQSLRNERARDSSSGSVTHSTGLASIASRTNGQDYRGESRLNCVSICSILPFSLALSVRLPAASACPPLCLSIVGNWSGLI